MHIPILQIRTLLPRYKRILQNLLSVKPHLPLIAEKSIWSKLNNLIGLVKKISHKYAKSQEKHLEAKLDNLFDGAVCSCPLAIVPCTNPRNKCRNLGLGGCQQEHVIFEFPDQSKFPFEDRFLGTSV